MRGFAVEADMLSLVAAAVQGSGDQSRAPACSVNVPLCPNASSGNVGPVAMSTILPRPGGAGHRRDRGRWRPGARRAARPTATTR